MSFDPVTYAMAKAYSDKKGGYVEPGKVYTFDGNADGKTAIPVSSEFVGVKISNDTPSVEQITKVVFEADADGEHHVIEMTPEMWTVYTASGLKGLVLDGALFVFVSDGSVHESGFYVVTNESGYVSYVEFEETIHPIKPEYLPGVCLPVVEITSTAIPESDRVELTAEEKAQIEAALATGMPAVIKIAYIDVIPARIVCHWVGGGYFFTAPATDTWIAISVEDGSAFIGVVI